MSRLRDFESLRARGSQGWQMTAKTGRQRTDKSVEVVKIVEVVKTKKSFQNEISPRPSLPKRGTNFLLWKGGSRGISELCSQYLIPDTQYWSQI
jgi:hypothetical protein